MAEGRPLGFNEAMPPNWTTIYGKSRVQHPDAPLGGLICGVLDNKEPDEVEVIALDCDNAAAWQLFTALDPSYRFRSASIGKPGGTVLYALPPALREVPQFSLNNGVINIEYMAKRPSSINAMVYLPTTANQTKETLQHSVELTEPPEAVIALVLSLAKPAQAPTLHLEESTELNLPYNAPLLAQYVVDLTDDNNNFIKADNQLTQKVYRIFTPRKFRSAKQYEDEKFLHPNSEDLLSVGPWSEYIVGVSAIAGADPSVSPKLYTSFIQALNAQLDDPMPAPRLLTEVIGPMVNQKASINGKPIWKYDEKWDQTSLTIVNQYGETLEHFALDGATGFIEYNHTTKALVQIPSIAVLRDQVYVMNANPEHERPGVNIVKKLKLVEIQNSVKYPMGFYNSPTGHALLNTIEACPALSILRKPESFSNMPSIEDRYVQAYNVFISHLLNHDKQAISFLNQVIAYHGRHLNSIPVILYVIGVGGAGKSLFAEMLELLFGKNATSRPTTSQLSNRFNDYLEDTAILILSETSDASARAQSGIKGVLKTLTGENTLDIETKYKPIKCNVPVFALPVLLANDPWYQEDTADRRLFSIMPRTTMLESATIQEFEQSAGSRIVDDIRQGIKLGIIPKYISSFCPDTLPPVPLTIDKKLLSMAQQDPIMVVKNLVATSCWTELFNLFEEHDVDTFFTLMNSPKSIDKNWLFKNQLVDLVKALRGPDTFALPDGAISREFTVRWLPNIAKQSRPANALLKKMGYVKWSVPIQEEYEKWQIESMDDYA